MKIICLLVAAVLIGCAAPKPPEPKVIILKIEKDESLKDKELTITIYPKKNE